MENILMSNRCAWCSKLRPVRLECRWLPLTVSGEKLIFCSVGCLNAHQGKVGEMVSLSPPEYAG